MKKHIRIAAVLLVLAMILASCGKSNDTSNTFNRSSAFDDNGYWKDVKASEYVTVPELSSITIKQEDIEAEKAVFLSSYPDTKEVKDRAVADGDTVNIDYVGSVDGVEFEGGSTNGAGTTVTIGVTSYIDGFLDQLVGHFPGETFDINVTFPDPYENNTDLSGKAAVFKITINYIAESVLPTWNDEFVANNLSAGYGWATTADAEEAIKSHLAEEYVFKNSEFLKDVPDAIIEYQVDSMLEYYKTYATYYGLELEDFVKNYFSVESLDAFKADYREEALETAQFYLIYQAYAEKLNYVAGEADIKAYFRDMNPEAENPEDYSEYEKNFGLPYLKAMVMYDAMSRKILESAKVTQ